MSGFNKLVLVLLAGVGGLSLRAAAAEPPPPCLTARAGETVQAAVSQTRPAPEELLARLVYAETQSTGFAEDERVHQAIAWGVMNRVRLGEASPALRSRYGHGLSGVIFRKGQFNPAISARSPFSRDFLCPESGASWARALGAARIALRGQNNPFIQTAWERRHNLSLVVNFYYPGSSQARGPLAPWERSPELRFIGEAAVGKTPLPAQRIRLYRLATPPRLSDP